jgi:hypothetical protein
MHDSQFEFILAGKSALKMPPVWVWDQCNNPSHRARGFHAAHAGMGN